MGGVKRGRGLTVGGVDGDGRDKSWEGPEYGRGYWWWKGLMTTERAGGSEVGFLSFWWPKGDTEVEPAFIFFTFKCSLQQLQPHLLDKSIYRIYGVKTLIVP